MYEIYRITACRRRGYLGLYGCNQARMQNPGCNRVDAWCVFVNDCVFAVVFVHEVKARQAGGYTHPLQALREILREHPPLLPELRA